ETTNFTQRSVYRNANPDTLKITERFTKVAPNKLRWSVTLDDPKTWMKPWTFSMPLTLNDAEPIQLYECHEGNYGLRNIPSAGRGEERGLSNATEPEGFGGYVRLQVERGAGFSRTNHPSGCRLRRGGGRNAIGEVASKVPIVV